MSTDEIPDDTNSDFIMAMRLLDPGFSFRDWRKSREWQIFKAGFNAAVDEANRNTIARYAIGETARRVFHR